MLLTKTAAASSLSVRNTDIQIGFRVTKITLDRGGWFDPTPFNASGELQHLEPYVPVSHGQPEPSAKSVAAEYQRLRTNALLPAFPTSFLVAKDVTMVVNLQDSKSVTASQVQQAASSASAALPVMR